MRSSSPSTWASAPSGEGCAMSASGRIALKPALDPEFLRALRPAWVPAGILVATALLAWLVPLPASLAGLRTAAPYALLVTALGMAWRFNRGRAFVIAASLLGAFAAYDLLATRGVYALLTVLVPLNVLVAMIYPERGARYRAAYGWLALLAAEGVFLAWIAGVPEGFLDNPFLRSPPTPLAGRLAFRDILTGLPGRRALEERLRGLGSRYAIAMVDVDHFKKFNDTHGHDIGDQVLKLVGARLAEVGGGGIAFRYGGEEFSVLFPGAKLADALPHLEAIRASIESYRMAVRSPDRPRSKEAGSKRRGEGVSEKSISVTVSIGACAPGKNARTPAQVVKAADEALYRAKQGGRNRVST